MKRGTLLLVLVVLCALGDAACGGNGHHTPVVTSANFTFYVLGESENSSLYCVAGVVSIATAASADGSFAVVGGEQDYNDGDTLTSPEPNGDTITGGSLVLGSSGTGTLTLITTNSALGVDGTETFAIVFPNPDHALITEFDASATSSGSIDLQTSTAMPSGSFAFTATGVAAPGEGFEPTAFGGVFSVASGVVTGTVDSNLGGDVIADPGTAIPAGVTLGAPDSFGRGSVIGNIGIAANLNYYVVGPEVIRIIDVDSTTEDTAVGSAYGQGANPNFSSGSIGPSVFFVSDGFIGYAAVGQFITAADDSAEPRAGKIVRETPDACSGTGVCLFGGVGDLNELGETQSHGQNIGGGYEVASNGYGFLTFGDGFGDLGNFGVYAVDPTLNILDPNDTTDTTGGALFAEMDNFLVGTGSIVPQTDIVAADFAGTYAGGGSGETIDDFNEFDFLALATVTEPGGAFSAIVAVSDPFGALTGTDQETTNATFAGAAVPDGANPGRYDLNPLTLASPDFPSITMVVVAYQASASQLFWVETDSDSYFGGSLEQFPGTGGADAKKAKPNNIR
jgi:hypothetical protein